MNIKINCQAFLDKKKIISLNSLEASINDYEIKELEILGNIKIVGNGYLNNLEEISEIAELVPFNVLLNDKISNNFQNLTLDVENFVFNIIDGRGLELEFDISVNLEPNIKDDSLEQEVTPELIMAEAELENTEIANVLLDDSRNIEKTETEENILKEQIDIKEEIVQQIDVLLSNKLSIKNDNFPDSKLPMRGLIDKKSQIKIIFYQDDKELDEVIKKYKMNINNVLTYRKIDNEERRRLIIHG